MILKKVVIYLICIIILGLIIGIFTVKTNKNKSINTDNKTAEASSSQTTLSSQADWGVGTYNSGIDLTTSPGDVKLKEASKIDTSGMTVTVSTDEGNKLNVIDGNITTYWGVITSESIWWKIDLGSTFTISKFKIMIETVAANSIQVSTDDVDYSVAATPSGGDIDWQELIVSPPVNARYIKFVCNATGMAAAKYVRELEIYSSVATATHTSAPTQITNDNLYEWQTFTPTYTEPANTDISFKFRTSTNSTDWSDWTTSQTVASGSPLDITSLVTSKTGDPGSETFYKYIQVETTLTSTDGVSTPTLSDYTIGYHTNVKPNAPTAQSVTIGS